MPDIIVLAGCGTIKITINELLQRHQSIGCRKMTFDVYDLQDIREMNANQRLDQQDLFDSGCYLQCHEFLRNYYQDYKYAMVLFDFHGYGSPVLTSEEIEREVEHRLKINGWDNRAATIVLDPEVESWVWSQSPQVESVLGWNNRNPRLRDWLLQHGHIQRMGDKPKDPKKAMLEALRVVNKKFTSFIHRELAHSVSLTHCQDRSFNKFKTTIKTWFPIETES